MSNAEGTSATFSPGRGRLVTVAIGVVLSGLIGRVAYLQTYGRQQTILRLEKQHHRSEPLPSRRGGIFDTNGTLLAGSVQNQGVFVDPQFMQEQYQEENRFLEMDGDLQKLAKLLDRNAFELQTLIRNKSEERYIVLSQKVDGATAAAVRQLNIPGVGLLPVNERMYPMGSLAAHIIGGVGKEQHGLEGIEMKFEKVLQGRDGFQRVLKDARRRPIGVAEDDYIEPEHGQHLVLTIDANIQTMAEQELAHACEKYEGKRGEVIVMDPKTGDVLALANYPTFDPLMISEARKEIIRDNALVSPYEPGSAIKPFIVGPAFASGVTTPAAVWPIGGETWESRGRHITDVHGYGPLNTWDVLVKSSNIGMSMLSEKMDNPRLHAALTSFGFGRQTGIDLPGEDAGLLHPLAKWTGQSTISIAQGYELMVTPLQLARGFCVYANGGKLPPVRIVKGTLDAKGAVINNRPRPSLEQFPEVLKLEEAAKIRRILADVPVRGTATAVKKEVPTWYIWNIFGKTGTAHISEGKAGYSKTKYNSTFIGGAPYENPRLIIAMTIHEADRSKAYYGGVVSGPPSAAILDRALAYLQVDASPELPLPPPEVIAHMVHYDPNVYHKPATQPSATAFLR